MSVPLTTTSENQALTDLFFLGALHGVNSLLPPPNQTGPLRDGLVRLS